MPLIARLHVQSAVPHPAIQQYGYRRADAPAPFAPLIVVGVKVAHAEGRVDVRACGRVDARRSRQPSDVYASTSRAKVSHWFTSPLSKPRLNQRMRCSDVLCVNDSGAT